MKKEFKKIYKTLKIIIEELDPVGFGAAGEYDDVLFEIIKINTEISSVTVFAQNTSDIIAKEFGIEGKNIYDSCLIYAKKIVSIYPDGLPKLELS